MTGPAPFEFPESPDPDRIRKTRNLMGEFWRRTLSASTFVPDPNLFAGFPVLATAALQEMLDARLADLLEQLASRLADGSDPAWPMLRPASVLSVDFAVAVSGQGWGLRLVELQTFTSVIATIHTQALGCREIWPEIDGMTCWGPIREDHNWVEQARSWMGCKPGSILLEVSPLSHRNRYDFEALAHWFGLPLVDVSELVFDAGRLSLTGGTPVPHIVNRVVLDDIPAERARGFGAALAALDIGWHNHPAWFYRVNKGSMAKMKLPLEERCVFAPDWMSLNLPPDDLVLKRILGCGGRSVEIAPPAASLSAAGMDWIVQPRFTPVPLLSIGGRPIFGEIRCVVALEEGSPPWLASQFMRMYAGDKANTGKWSGLPGEGFSPLFRPRS